MPQLISIDFGTTKTALAIRDLENGSDPRMRDFGTGNSIETVMRFTEDGRDIDKWGAEAWGNCFQYPERTFYEFKPEIGSTKEFDVAGKKKNAAYLTKTFLKHLFDDLEKMYNGAPLSPQKFTTWIGHPAEWNEAQKTQLLECAQDAGWPNVDLCDEATATAFYFADQGDLPTDKPCKFMVFDFGGGTLDVCIMKMDEKRVAKILSVGGDSSIGGRRFDDCLVDHFRKEILSKAVADSLNVADEVQIRLCCRKLKENLSHEFLIKKKEFASVTIPRLPALNMEEYTLTLSRTLFEELTEALRQRCRAVIEEVLKKAGIEANQIEKILIAGGSSRFYFVPDLIRSTFPDLKEGNIVRVPQPSEVVAKGLGIYPLPEKKRKPFPTLEPQTDGKQTGKGKTQPPALPSGKKSPKILMKVRLGLAIVAFAVAGTIWWQHFTECRSCHGMGFVKCPHCAGDGKVWVSIFNGKENTVGPQKQVDCPTCNGNKAIKCPPRRAVF